MVENYYLNKPPRETFMHLFMPAEQPVSIPCITGHRFVYIYDCFSRRIDATVPVNDEFLSAALHCRDRCLCRNVQTSELVLAISSGRHNQLRD